MFLFLTDYYNPYITPEDLNEVTGNDDTIRVQAEPIAQAFVSSYIRQRYDVSKIFKSWTTWSVLKAYIPTDYFKYTEPAFSASATYLTGARVSYNGNIYSSKSGSTAGVWNVSFWNLICVDNLIFTCILNSTGHYPENTTYFTQTDPRSPEIVDIMIKVVLYNIHSLIVPNNIPKIRREQYNNDGQAKAMDGTAIGTLIAYQKGDLMPDLPIYADAQRGQNITYGSNMKRNTSY
jgi:hypothetical protein